MKIYIVHIDAWEDERPFHEVTNEEIEKLYKEDDLYISKYDSLEQLACDWNSDACFYPDMSYMRIIND